jgi:hypothetical protein
MIRYWRGSTEITTDFGQRGCGLGLTGGQVIVVLNGSPRRCRPGAQGPPAHAPARLRIRPRQQGARHPGDPGLARTSLDHQHRRLHGVGAEPVQGFLARLRRLWSKQPSLPRSGSIVRSHHTEWTEAAISLGSIANQRHCRFTQRMLHVSQRLWLAVIMHDVTRFLDVC